MPVWTSAALWKVPNKSKVSVWLSRSTCLCWLQIFSTAASPFFSMVCFGQVAHQTLHTGQETSLVPFCRLPFFQGQQFKKTTKPQALVVCKSTLNCSFLICVSAEYSPFAHVSAYAIWLKWALSGVSNVLRITHKLWFSALRSDCNIVLIYTNFC